MSRRPIALAALLALGGTYVPLAEAQPAVPRTAETVTRLYDLPASPLAAALSRFAAESGVLFSANAQLTAGRNAPALRGSHSVETGFSALLAGSRLVAVRDAQGVYTLRAAPPPAPAAAPLPTPSAQRPAPNPPVAEPTLPPTIVTATRDRRENTFDTPGSVSIVTREDIDRSGARHVSEILQATPGVSTVTNEQVPSVSVNIRGLKDFGRVNMNIDGVRQNYQRSGHQQRNGEMFFDPELLSGIDITKGPSSELGGAGVLGGVATFRTLDVSDLLDKDQRSGGRLRLTTGTNANRFSGSLAGAWRLGDDVEAVLAASGRSMGAYKAGTRGQAFDFGNTVVPVGVVNLTDQDMDSQLAKLRWRPAAGHELTATALTTSASFAESSTINADLAYAYQTACGGGTVQSVYCADVSSRYALDNFYPKSSDSRVQAQQLSLDYRFKPGSAWLDLHAKLYHADTRNNTLGQSGGVSYLSITRTRTMGMSLDNTSIVRLGPLDLEWKQGGEYFRDEVRPAAESAGLTGGQLGQLTGGTPQGDRWLASVFTRAMLSYDDWLQVNGGLRYDWYHLWGRTGFKAMDSGAGNIPLPAYEDIRVDRREAALSPTLGVAVTPAPHVQIFANAGKGWRPPAVTESLITGAHPNDTSVSYYPNYLLESERSRHAELGVNFKFDNLASSGDKLRVKLALFRTTVDNYIYYTAILGVPGQSIPGLGRAMFVNALDPTTFHGAEIDLRYDARAWYAGFAYTGMQREGQLSRKVFPLGGATGVNAALMNAQVDTLSGGLYNPLPPRDRFTLDVGGRFLERQLTAGSKLTCSSPGGSPGNLNSFSNAQNSFCVVDLYGHYAFSKAVSLAVNLKNLADRQYAQAMGDAYVRSYAPGRTLLATVQWNF